MTEKTGKRLNRRILRMTPRVKPLKPFPACGHLLERNNQISHKYYARSSSILASHWPGLLQVNQEDDYEKHHAGFAYGRESLNGSAHSAGRSLGISGARVGLLSGDRYELFQSAGFR